MNESIQVSQKLIIKRRQTQFLPLKTQQQQKFRQNYQHTQAIITGYDPRYFNQQKNDIKNNKEYRAEHKKQKDSIRLSKTHNKIQQKDPKLISNQPNIINSLKKKKKFRKSTSSDNQQQSIEPLTIQNASHFMKFSQQNEACYKKFTDAKVYSHGFTQAAYQQIFPLGSKSYGVVYQNYYCLIVGDNEVIHINRSALPESSLVFANFQVVQDIVYMQSINIANNLIFSQNQHEREKIDEIRPTQPYILHESKKTKLKSSKFYGEENQSNKNIVPDSFSSKYLNKQNDCDDSRFRLEQSKKVYLHVNFTQYNLKMRKVTGNNNYCLPLKSPQVKSLKVQDKFGYKICHRNNKVHNKRFFSLGQKVSKTRCNAVDQKQTQRRYSTKFNSNQQFNYEVDCEKRNILSSIKSISLVSNKRNQYLNKLTNILTQAQIEAIIHCHNNKQGSQSNHQQEGVQAFDSIQKDQLKGTNGLESKYLPESNGLGTSMNGNKIQPCKDKGNGRKLKVTFNTQCLSSQRNRPIKRKTQDQQKNDHLNIQKKFMQSIDQNKLIIKQGEKEAHYISLEQSLELILKRCHIQNFTVVVEQNSQELQKQSTSEDHQMKTGTNACNIITIYSFDLKQHIVNQFLRRFKTNQDSSLQANKQINFKRFIDSTQLQYQLLNCKPHRQYLHEGQKTVRKNWLHCQKNTIFLTTNLSVYKIQNLDNNENNRIQKKQQNMSQKIRCINLKILQQIFQYEKSKIYTKMKSTQFNQKNSSEDQKQDNIYNMNEQRLVIQQQTNSALQLIHCSWINQNRYIALVSNNTIYDIQIDKIVKSQNLLDLILTNEQHEKEHKNSQKQQFIDSQKLVKIQQIQCAQDQNNLDSIIIVRVQKIGAINSKLQPSECQTRSPTEVQSFDLYTFKYNRRWTELYSKIQNFTNDKVMSGLLPNFGKSSCQGRKIINYTLIECDSIMIKILHNCNSLPEQFLENRQVLNKDITKKYQFHVYCQWGVGINNNKMVSQKFTNQHFVRYPSSNKCNTWNSNAGKQKNWNDIQKSTNSLNHEQIKTKIRRQNKGNLNSLLDMQLFIVELNIFGRSLGKQNQLNPIHIKLQDYYHSNIKNIYEVVFRNRNLNEIYDQNSIKPQLSCSANVFNMALLSLNHQNLSIYQKNISPQVKLQHFLQVGVNTKQFVEKFTHRFELGYLPNCVCIDNFGLNLACAMNDRIVMYYILEDRLVRGTELNISEVICLKYDIYNWHLFANNKTTLFVIDPWKLKVKRALSFDGQILQVNLQDAYALIKWKQKISQTLLLTIISIYEVAAETFRTCEIQLVQFITKDELNQNFSQKVKANKFGRYINSLGGKGCTEEIGLKYCYEIDTASNTLLVLNQFFIDVYDMKFTAAQQLPNVPIKSQEFSYQNHSTLKFFENSMSNFDIKNLNSKSRGTNMGRRASIHRRTSICTNASFIINNSLANLDKVIQAEPSQSQSNTSKSSLQSSYSTSRPQSKYETKVEEKIEQGMQIGAQEQIFVNRIEISYQKSSERKQKAFRAMFSLYQQWPTCFKYEKSLSILIIGTNLGKLLMIPYDPKTYRNNSFQYAAPFYCQKVSQSQIVGIIVSKSILSIFLHLFVPGSSIITYLLGNEGSQNKISIGQNQDHQDVNNLQQKQRKNLCWKQIKNNYKFKQLFSTFVGDYQIHSQLSSKYGVYNSWIIKGFTQEIQQLELRLLKIRGDQEQFLIKDKERLEQEAVNFEKAVHRLKIGEKLQENKLLVAAKTSLSHLNDFYNCERNNTQGYVLQKLKKEYHQQMISLFNQHSKLQQQHENLKKQLELKSKKVSEAFCKNINEISQKYDSKLELISEKIVSLVQQIQKMKKIFAIEIQQTNQQFKVLKNTKNDQMDQLLQKEMIIEAQQNFAHWNLKRNLREFKEKFNEIEQLSLQFNLELNNWRNAMLEKSDFYRKCNVNYQKLQHQVEQKQKQWVIIDSSNEEKKWGKKSKPILSKIICNLHLQIKNLTEQIKMKQQNYIQLQREEKQLSVRVNTTSLQLQNKQGQLSHIRSKVKQKSNYLQFLKARFKQYNIRNIAAKKRKNRLIQNIFMFVDECLSGYYEVETKQLQSSKYTANINQNNRFRTLSLKQVKPSKYDQRHLQFLNSNIPNIKITEDKEGLVQYPTTNMQSFQQDKIKEQEFRQFLQMLQLIKRRKVLFETQNDFVKNWAIFMKMFEFRKSYSQNRQLVAQLNQLRESNYKLQSRLQIIQNQFKSIKETQNLAQEQKNQKNIKRNKSQPEPNKRRILSEAKSNGFKNKFMRSTFDHLQKNAKPIQLCSQYDPQKIKKRFRIFSFSQTKIYVKEAFYQEKEGPKLKNKNQYKLKGSKNLKVKQVVKVSKSGHNQSRVDKNQKSQQKQKKKCLSIQKFLERLDLKYRQLKEQTDNNQDQQQKLSKRQRQNGTCLKSNLPKVESLGNILKKQVSLHKNIELKKQQRKLRL